MTTAILDNGIEYIVMDTITLDGTVYTLFSELQNEMNYCFRKTTVKDGINYYSGLDDKQEFDKVLLAFAEKINR